MDGPSPSAHSLHLGEMRLISDVSHGENLTFDEVIEELISLHQQVILDRLVLCKGVAALRHIFGGAQCNVNDLLNRHSRKLLFEGDGFASPSFEGQLLQGHVVLAIVGAVSEHELQKLDVAAVVSPPLPDDWEESLVLVPSHLPASHMLLHQGLVGLMDIVVKIIDFIFRVSLLLHEALEVVNLSSMFPILNSYRTRFIHLILKFCMIMPHPPPIKGISLSLRLNLAEEHLELGPLL